MGDRTGQQIGYYRLVKLLGEGGFAEVYLGQHVHLASRQAAIKILHLVGVDQRKFQEEAETTAKLDHPHIVHLLDAAIEQGEPFLVLEYAPGGPLRARHPKGSVVPLASVGAYLKEIAPALQYAHDKDILHLDIKPENILIGQGGELMLSDFGVALLMQTGQTSLEAIHGIGGTSRYMAPESFLGRPKKASDQYSLAIVLYELLCGSPPFRGENRIQLGYQHNHEPVPPLREKNQAIPVDIEAVITRALAKKPEDRFANVQALAEAFERAVENAYGTTLPAQSSQPYRSINELFEQHFQEARKAERPRFAVNDRMRHTEKQPPKRPLPGGPFAPPSRFAEEREEIDISGIPELFRKDEGKSSGRKEAIAVLRRIHDEDKDPSWTLFDPEEYQLLRNSIRYYRESEEWESSRKYIGWGVCIAVVLLVILAAVMSSWILFVVGLILVLATACAIFGIIVRREVHNSVLVVTPDLFLWGNWVKVELREFFPYQAYAHFRIEHYAIVGECLVGAKTVFDIFSSSRSREDEESIPLPALFKSHDVVQAIVDAHEQFLRSKNGKSPT
jgi:serine/threonine protein kinase